MESIPLCTIHLRLISAVNCRFYIRIEVRIFLRRFFYRDRERYSCFVARFPSDHFPFINSFHLNSLFFPNSLNTSNFRLNLNFLINLLSDFISGNLNFYANVTSLNFVVNFRLFDHFPNFNYIIRIQHGLITTIFRSFRRQFVNRLYRGNGWCRRISRLRRRNAVGAGRYDSLPNYELRSSS